MFFAILDAMAFPEEAGILLSGTRNEAFKSFVLQTHFDNSKGESGVKDDSGVTQFVIHVLTRPTKACEQSHTV